MKFFTTIILFALVCRLNVSYAKKPLSENYKTPKIYFYWGWNGSSYSKSNIHFKGNDYDFTLNKVFAKDRQSPFSLNTYFNPLMATIPQYNFRLGYCFNDNWDISFGIDHMKYVVQQNQTVEINGNIDNPNSYYYGSYHHQNIQLTEDFLKFEHTDGLNYINTEIRHSNDLLNFKKVNINLVKGFGIGLLYPRTNTTLLGKETYDQFHVSGYGLGALLGLKATFYNFFFIQSELKGGYINLPDVRTTHSKFDRADHQFCFLQRNIVVGGVFNLKPTTKRK